MFTSDDRQKLSELQEDVDDLLDELKDLKERTAQDRFEVGPAREVRTIWVDGAKFVKESKITGGTFTVGAGDCDFVYGFDENEPIAIMHGGRRFVPQRETTGDFSLSDLVLIANRQYVPGIQTRERMLAEMDRRTTWEKSFYANEVDHRLAEHLIRVRNRQGR